MAEDTDASAQSSVLASQLTSKVAMTFPFPPSQQRTMSDEVKQQLKDILGLSDDFIQGF